MDDDFAVHPERGRGGAKKGHKYPFPFVDLEFDLYFDKMHDVDSSQDAFYLCALEAFREAQDKAGIQLLEPIMKVVVVSPKDYLGQISGNISSKRGVIEDTTEDRGVAQVSAKIPLATSSVTRATCARQPRAKRASAWSSATTPRCRWSWRTCRRGPCEAVSKDWEEANEAGSR